MSRRMSFAYQVCRVTFKVGTSGLLRQPCCLGAFHGTVCDAAAAQANASEEKKEICEDVLDDKGHDRELPYLATAALTSGRALDHGR